MKTLFKIDKTGIELISEEREEQIKKHGFDSSHDKEHMNGELLVVAQCLITNDYSEFPKNWGSFYMEKLMSKTGIEALKIAGALIAAEIDRLRNINYENERNQELIELFKFNLLCARATLFPNKTIEEVDKIIDELSNKMKLIKTYN